MSESLPGGDAPLILVIDDSRDMRAQYVHMLGRDRYRLQEAGTGEEALALFAESVPDLVLLDVAMPGMDGIETCARLRELPGGRRAQVLMVTALDDPDSVESAFAAGADEYVTKPVRWAVLRHRLRNLLESRRQEERARSSAERFRLLAENVRDIFWIASPDGAMIEYVSPAFEETWGVECEALYRNPALWLEAVHSDDRERVKAEFHPKNIIQGSFDVEFRILRADGALRWIQARGYPIRDEGGRGERFAGIAVDITGFKEVDRLKSLFIASMSHELRTPLNSVIGFSSILLEEWPGPLNDRQKEDLASILRAGRHLLCLVNDVIDVSKIEAGQLDTHSEEFDLYEVIGEAAASLSKEFAEKGLALVVEKIRLPMRTDRTRLLQCILNLLSNALKYSTEGSCLLGARRDPGGEERVEISVTDTGIGIGEEDRPKIFQPFMRLDSPLKKREPGTGLGLYLTRKLAVEVLQGEIGFSSVPGEGSRFFLSIPVERRAS